MRTSEFLPQRRVRLRSGLRQRATTLVEMLVVIVIFLVGILAVVQIFPGGFRLLAQARKQAQAAALARSEAERLKGSPEGIPEMILPTQWAELTNPSTSNLGPAGTSITATGDLMSVGGINLGHWAFNTGANRFRLIESEHHRMSAPRKIGFGAQDFGCAFLPTFGLVEGGYTQVSGNLLALETRIPEDLTGIGGNLFTTATTFGDFTAAIFESSSPALYVPTSDTDREYRIYMDVTVQIGGSNVSKTLRALPVFVAATTKGANDSEFPLYSIDLNALASANLASAESLVSVETSSLRLRRAYRQVASFSNDPFEYKSIEPVRGLLLFNPNAAAASVSTGSGRSPLEVVVSYITRDWRVLRQDVRLNESDSGQIKLPLGSIKTSSASTPDGLNTSALAALPVSSFDSPAANHFTVLDLETGGIIAEQAADGKQLVVVDKTLGLVNFVDADSSTPDLDVRIVLPTGGDRLASIGGRALRVLYEAREEWSVQILRAASRYSPSATTPTAGRFYVGGTNTAIGGLGTRIYFPAEDAGQSVTVNSISIIRTDSSRGQLSSQRFTLRYHTGDPVNLPSLDVRDADANASAIDATAGSAVSGVSGSSLQVRTLWNPDYITLSATPAENMTKVDQWGRGWRQRITQVFIDREDGN